MKRLPFLLLALLLTPLLLSVPLVLWLIRLDEQAMKTKTTGLPAGR